MTINTSIRTEAVANGFDRIRILDHEPDSPQVVGTIVRGDCLWRDATMSDARASASDRPLDGMPAIIASLADRFGEMPLVCIEIHEGYHAIYGPDGWPKARILKVDGGWRGRMLLKDVYLSGPDFDAIADALHEVISDDFDPQPKEGLISMPGDKPERNETDTQLAAEATILGSLMMRRSLMMDLGAITPAHFADQIHGKAWSVLVADHEIEDELALQIAVPEMDEEHLSRIRKSNHKDAIVIRARDYVIESRSRRDLKRILRNALADLDDRDKTADVIASGTAQAIVRVDQTATTSISAREAARKLLTTTSHPVIPTGIMALDYVTYGGLHRGILTAILARYKVGKTVMAATLAHNLELSRIPTLVVTLERLEGDIEKFIVARSLNRDARDLDLSEGSPDREFYDEYMEADRPLRYIHRPGITKDELRARILADHYAHGTKVVLLDYWQLVTNPGLKGTREEKQSDIGQMLADLASTLGIAIVTFGQLNAEGGPKGAEALLGSAGIAIRINREEHDENGFLDTLVSNKGPALSKGNPNAPSITLDQNGPHYRDYRKPLAA